MTSAEFSLATATCRDFAPLIDESFGVRPDEDSENALTIELVSAAESERPGALRNPFALEFTGPVDFPLDQGTYFLNHASLGTFPLFIVPIAADSETRRYQAIFN